MLVEAKGNFLASEYAEPLNTMLINCFNYRSKPPAG